jgi:hypothetical protein
LYTDERRYNMLDKIKSAFFEVEEDPKKKEEAVAEEAPSEAAPQAQPQAVPVVPGMPVAATAIPLPAQPAATSVAPAVPMAGAVNPEMAEMLAGAIEAADLEGFDYLEFKESLVGMASVPMTEQQKFLAVYATAQTMGASRGGILNSIDHYVSVIEQKKAEFAGHVEQKIAAEVTAREEKIAANNAAVEEATQQMQALTERIQTLQAENQALENEKIAESQSIQATQASFDATFNMVSGKLQEDKTKIETYLPAAAAPAPAPEAS